MKDSRRLLIPALAASLLGAVSISAEDVNSSSIPVVTEVRTEEDIEQGKKNVQSVADQLREMFRPIQKQARVTKPVEPYLKVVDISDDSSILIYRCRYATASKLLNSVEAMVSDNGLVEYAEEQNLITIRDLKTNIKAISTALPELDIPSSQVLIEAKIVEVMITDNSQRNLSFNFQSPTTVSMIDAQGQRYDGDTMSNIGTVMTPVDTSNPTDMANSWTFASGHNNFNVALQWLLTAQDARVLSSPVIVVARNEEAKISTGQDQPIQSQTITNGSISTSTTFKRVGVTLTVEPLMINDDNVTLRVEPEVSNVQSTERISVSGGGSYSVPVISIRSIASYLRLSDGQIVIMGGLYHDSNSIQQKRVPFLSDIPYLGELFTSKYTQKNVTQLLFFLRVRILNPDDLADGVLFDPEESISTTEKIAEIMRGSELLPEMTTSVEKVKNEFFDNPLVTFQSIKDFFSTDKDKKDNARNEGADAASDKNGTASVGE